MTKKSRRAHVLKYEKDGRDIILYQQDFDLDETLDCGQAFRWQRDNTQKNVTYTGAYLNVPLTVSQEGEGVFRLKDTDEDTFKNVWYGYFDLATDYGDIKKQLSADVTMAKACAYAGGIRLLRQDGWEALCSFIISQNNNIPRIKGIIGRLCEHFKGFPPYEKLADLSPDDLAFLRAGFRAKYIIDAAKKLRGGEVDLERIKTAPIDRAQQELMKICGVGPKVAQCALLYGMHRVEAFPVDVWIKRVLQMWYPDGLPKCCRGIEGIAQQYLFHYIRTGVQSEK